MARPLETTLASLRQARAGLVELLNAHPNLGRPLGSILAALGAAEESLAQLRGGEEVGTTFGAKKKGSLPKSYERHVRGDEEFLAEYRADSPYPFRASRRVLDGVADVLAIADRPLRFAELKKAVSRRLGESPPEYQLHVCLRLLREYQLVRARGNAYAAPAPRSLRRQVVKTWRGLKDE
jgi:hypothetical protein